MKRQVLHSVVCGLAAVALSSCASKVYNYEEHYSKTMSLGEVGSVMPVAADLEIDKDRKTLEKSFDNDLGEGGVKAKVDEMKNATSSEFMKKYNADLIVAEQCNVTSDAEKVVVSVAGYPARYVNFRKLTLEDIELLQKNNGGSTKAADAPTSPALPFGKKR